MESPPRLPAKRDVCRQLMLRGSVFVHLDPRQGGVDVPSHLRDQAQLVLQVGLDMPIPIADLHVDDHAVSGTLAFASESYRCVVPWEAVFAILGEDGRGMVWPDSVPEEIAAELKRETQGEREPNGSPRQRHLRLTRAGEAASSHGQDEENVVRLGDFRSTPPPTTDTPSSADAADDNSEAEASKEPPSPPKGKSLPPYLRVVK